MKPWFLLVAVLALFLGGCAGSVRNTSRSFKTVVIDAGHGGHDNGATTRYAGREKNLALDVALRLRPKLQAAGFETVMTRSDDTFIPLDTRARISNGQSNAMFVSIHFNYSPRSSAEGAEVYYKSRVSTRTAQNILAQIAAIPGVDSRGVKTANFRVLKKATFPAVLVECGFLTNPSEGRRCGSAGHREALAEAIARGLIIQRHGKLPPQPTAPPTPPAPIVESTAPKPAVVATPTSAKPAVAAKPAQAKSKKASSKNTKSSKAKLAKPKKKRK